MATSATDASLFNILIVDDFLGAGDWIATLLEHRGYPSRIARTGAEALKLGRLFQPRAVIMDLGLPDASGIDVACQLRREPGCADAHFIALTGGGDEDLRTRWRHEGLGPYLRKPVPSENLLNLLDELRLATMQAPAAPEPLHQTAAQIARLLVIANHLADVLMLQRALREALVPFHMEVIEDGDEALRWLEAPTAPAPHLVIIDLHLPRHDGLELVRCFRASNKFPRTRFVVLASAPAPGDHARAKAIGVDAFTHKPTQVGAYLEIGETLRRLLAA